MIFRLIRAVVPLFERIGILFIGTGAATLALGGQYYGIFAVIGFLLMITPDKRIASWATRHIAGEKVMFYDDLLAAWAKSIDCFMFDHAHPDSLMGLMLRSRRKLRRDHREAQGNMLLIRARLDGFLWAIMHDEDLPPEHRARLQESISHWKEKAEELLREPRLKEVSSEGRPS